MRYRSTAGILACGMMFAMIMDSRTALQAAAEGIDLCIKTVIPSLFPFIFLSDIITRELAGKEIFLLRPVGKLLKLPKGSDSILISSFLGGYPCGARTVYTAWTKGQVSREDAERLLGYTNHAGPAFLFGMVAGFFPDVRYAWALWIIHILAAILTGMCLSVPVSFSGRPEAARRDIPQSLRNALEAISSICGWILVFRILHAFGERWILWIMPVNIQCILTGILELSNGCAVLSSIENINHRFLIASGILGFGGLCVGMQTTSVCKGLKLRNYWMGKCLQGLFSMMLCVSVRNPFFLLPAILLYLFLWKKEKRDRNPLALGV